MVDVVVLVERMLVRYFGIYELLDCQIEQVPWVLISFKNTVSNRLHSCENVVKKCFTDLSSVVMQDHNSACVHEPKT